MSVPPETPVIIGVGDVVNRSKKIEDAIEPLGLIVEAIQKALTDTSLSPTASAKLRNSIDSLDVVRSWTWPYPDLPGSIAERLEIEPQRRHYSEHGGNQPALLLDEAARRVSKGENQVAVVTGGEALASLVACANAKRLPPPGWTKPAEDVNKVFSPTTRELQPNLGSKHHIGNPIHIYPLYENGFRAYRNQSLRDNHAESAAMYAEFAQIAAGNAYAWNYGATPESAETIGKVSAGRNRMICFPYPMLMNAFNNVNLAAACIVTSAGFARDLGVAEEQWVYPLGGAGTRDSYDFWQRPTFWWSPAISRSLDAGLQVSGIKKEDVDLYDLYSCFPIVPKLASQHLNLPFPSPNDPSRKPLTLLGGLTSFGGAGNNYSLHAITEMTRQLRSESNPVQQKGKGKGKRKTGLVLANGGWVTYQHVVCLSNSPQQRQGGGEGEVYPPEAPLPAVVDDVQVPRVEEEVEGEATVETYTLEYTRANQPHRGHIVGRLKANGARFIANHADARTLAELGSWEREPIGRSGYVRRSDDGRNVFSFDGLAGRERL
ncbi:hypothetical protein KC327_g6979 [Hortaea werneckii]|nr:hypothetical protein KC358_g7242 [Hortaea werneckii]KAI6837457.1 hypothetical protein KC350_g6050 [Hortaea werneckii]KAI6931406.1 hypothetical protein KC348_g7261 [Hortaea werneckii]KAI6936181.1 hypothetical protein KC341_g6429 [Hortaea werneckii]KAI6971177.1 hypothetical protein KC321_g6908 [Hortaea werneckii]